MDTNVIKLISDFADTVEDFKAGLYEESAFLHKIYELSAKIYTSLEDEDVSYLAGLKYKNWKERQEANLVR